MDSQELRQNLETGLEKLDDGFEFVASSAVAGEAVSFQAAFYQLRELRTYSADLRARLDVVSGGFAFAAGQYQEAETLIAEATEDAENQDAQAAHTGTAQLAIRIGACARDAATLDPDMAKLLGALDTAEHYAKQIMETLGGIALATGTLYQVGHRQTAASIRKYRDQI